MAKTRDVMRALFSNRPLLKIWCKRISLITNDLDMSLPSSVTNLLQEYQDVFPEEIPSGLPPLQGIEHQIDLISGASLPNKPPYQTNPEETKELQHQVEELLAKEWV